MAQTRPVTWGRGIGAALVVWLACSAACSSFDDPASAPAPVGIRLVVDTDLAAPAEIERVSIRISTAGTVHFLREIEVGPSREPLPGSLDIVPDSNEDGELPPTSIDPGVIVVTGKTVEIQIAGLQGSEYVAERSATVSFPEAGFVDLELTIERACMGQVQEVGLFDPSSTCPQGETCVGGACESVSIDVTTLPDTAI